MLQLDHLILAEPGFSLKADFTVPKGARVAIAENRRSSSARTAALKNGSPGGAPGSCERVAPLRIRDRKSVV